MKTPHKIQNYFFLVIFLAVIVLLLFIVKPFLTPLILAAVFAIIFRPVYLWFVKHLGKNEFVASIVTILLIILVIMTPMYYIGQQLFDQSIDVYRSLTSAENDSGVYQRLSDFVEDIVGSPLPAFDSTEFDQYVADGLSWLGQNLGSIFGSVAKIILNFFIWLLALFYLFKEGTKFKQKLISFSPLNDKYDREIINTLQVAVNSVIRGSLTIAIIQSVLAGFGMWLFGVPNPTLWGAVTLIVALIPGIGASLVLIPGVIYLIGTGSLGAGIGLGIWAATAVGLIDNLLGPKLIGSRIKVHSFLILLVVLGGLGFFGPIGFILGPLILSLFFALLHIYREIIAENVTG